MTPAFFRKSIFFLTARRIAGFVAVVFAFAVLPNVSHATPQYSAGANVSVNVSYDTNSAGLTDYRKMHVSASFSSTPANSEGIYGGTLTVYVGPYSFSTSIPGTPNPYNCSASVSNFFTVDPSNSGWTIYANATFNFWNQGGGNSGDGTYSTNSGATSPGPGTNTLGTASFSFGGGPWTYDGGSHSISISVSPASAGWTQTGGNSNGTETNSNSYNITVGPSNSDYQGSGSYSWTINKASMVAPSSAPSSATPGVGWSPPTWNVNTPAPSGGGYAWTVAARTNWGDGGWIPPVSDAGTSQTFYLAVYGPASNFNGAGDSHLPGMALAISSGYSVAVAKANQTISFGNPGTQTYGSAFGVSASASSGLGVTFSVVSGPASIAGSTVTPTGTGSVTIRASQGGNSQYNAAPDVDQAFTINKANQATVSVSANPTTITTAQSSALSASGGSGTGAYSYQVASGPGSISGSTMNPTGTGTVNVQAMRQGDGNYNASGWSSSAGITVNPAIITTTFSISNTNQTYDGSAKSVTVTPNPANATYSVTYNGSGSAPSGAGSYAVSVNGTGNFSGSASATLTINKANQSSVSISPTSQTTSTGNSIFFTASGGSGTGAYSWGGDGSGSSSTDNVTFNFAGGRTVTVSKNGDSNYSASNTASASITVNTSTSFSFSNTSFTFDGGSHGPTTIPNPGGATYSISGTSSAVAAGNYSFTVTATGSFSGSAVCNWSILTPGLLSYSGTTNFGSAYRDAQAGSPTSTTQNFSLTNTGQQPLTINSIVMTGNFSIASGPTLPLVLSGGSSTALTIRFTPSGTTGTNTGSCTVNTMANSPSFTLTGTGVAPKVNINWH